MIGGHLPRARDDSRREGVRGKQNPALGRVEIEASAGGESGHEDLQFNHQPSGPFSPGRLSSHISASFPASNRTKKNRSPTYPPKPFLAFTDPHHVSLSILPGKGPLNVALSGSFSKELTTRSASNRPGLFGRIAANTTNAATSPSGTHSHHFVRGRAAPQLGQARAVVLISCPHSPHLVIAISHPRH